MILLDVLTRLDDQTASESYETKTVMSVSKIASQRLKNRVDTTSVLQDKLQKPKNTRQKARTDATRPSPEPPNRGARLWGSAIAEPRKREGAALPWPNPQ